jgi:hypothetical protein
MEMENNRSSEKSGDRPYLIHIHKVILINVLTWLLVILFEKLRSLRKPKA